MSGMTLPAAHLPPDAAARTLRAAVLTVSDTRTLETDESGAYLAAQVTGAGHTLVARALVPDEAGDIGRALDGWLAGGTDVILTTGGTGIAGRDVTIGAVEARLTKPLPGFGELFRMLSYREVGGAAMLSRATGGLAGRTLIFALPGSLNAVRTGWEGLLSGQLGHLAHEVQRQGQPGRAQTGSAGAGHTQPR